MYLIILYLNQAKHQISALKWHRGFNLYVISVNNLFWVKDFPDVFFFLKKRKVFNSIEKPSFFPPKLVIN